MNALPASIFRYFLVLLDKQVLEIDSISKTIISDSSNCCIPDIFCAFNSGRLFKIIENRQMEFVLDNNEIIENSDSKNMIEIFLLKINDEKTGLKNEIYKKYRQENPKKSNFNQTNINISFFIKILNIYLYETTFTKLNTKIRLNLIRLRLNERELAQIIFSHSFSFVNAGIELMKDMIYSFIDDNFELKNFKTELIMLEQNFKITHNCKIIQSVKLADSNQNNDQNNVRSLSCISRNLLNFFDLFSEQYHLAIINEYGVIILRYYSNINSKKPIKVNLVELRKIFKLLICPCMLIYIEKNDFTFVNQVMAEVSSENELNHTYIDMSNVLGSELHSFSIQSFLKQKKEIDFFFENFLKKCEYIIKIGLLSFQYNEIAHNFRLYHHDFELISNLSLNDCRFYLFLDLVSRNSMQKMPICIQLLIRCYVNIFLLDEPVKTLMENIYIIQEDRNILDKYLMKLMKRQSVHGQQIQTLKRLHFNLFFLEFTRPNYILNQNFFLCNQIDVLKISWFIYHENLPELIFLFGKFRNVYIDTNKKIDMFINENYIFLALFKNPFCCMQSDFLRRFKTQTRDFMYNFEGSFNRSIKIESQYFEVSLNHCIIVKSRNISSSFEYSKSNDESINIIIRNCLVRFKGELPFIYSKISLKKTIIMSDVEKITCFSENNFPIALELMSNVLFKNPRFDVQKCSLYIYQNVGDFILFFDTCSYAHIFCHKGNVLLNNIFFIHFVSEYSFFEFETINFDFPFNVKTKRYHFFHIFLLKKVYIPHISMNIWFSNCKFNQGCELYIFDNKKSVYFNVFEMKNLKNNFHNYLMNIEIIDGIILKFEYFI